MSANPTATSGTSVSQAGSLSSLYGTGVSFPVNVSYHQLQSFPNQFPAYPNPYYHGPLGPTVLEMHLIFSVEMFAVNRSSGSLVKSVACGDRFTLSLPVTQMWEIFANYWDAHAAQVRINGPTNNEP